MEGYIVEADNGMYFTANMSLQSLGDYLCGMLTLDDTINKIVIYCGCGNGCHTATVTRAMAERWRAARG